MKVVVFPEILVPHGIQRCKDAVIEQLAGDGINPRISFDLRLVFVIPRNMGPEGLIAGQEPTDRAKGPIWIEGVFVAGNGRSQFLEPAIKGAFLERDVDPRSFVLLLIAIVELQKAARRDVDPSLR